MSIDYVYFRCVARYYIYIIYLYTQRGRNERNNKTIICECVCVGVLCMIKKENEKDV